MKRFLYIPFVLSLLLICSAKDIDDSFDRYTIGFVVADSTSLNTTYEKQLYRNLRMAGHTMRLIDDSRLIESTYDGVNNFSTLDMVIIPNFVDCPSVDTSAVGGIGDVPVLCLEDSLWGNFGFSISVSEPLIYIADYTNKRIIQTKWDGVDWKTTSLAGQNRKPYGLSLGASSFLVPDTSYIYFSVVEDSIFRMNWSRSNVWSYGSSGSGTGQFDAPTQIQVYDDTTADYSLLVSDRLNTRFVKTKFGNSSYWETKSWGRMNYGVFRNSNYYFYNLAKSSDGSYEHMYYTVYKNTDIDNTPLDSVNLYTSVSWAGYGSQLFATEDYLFSGGVTNKLFKISISSFDKVDSLNHSKVGKAGSVWYDEDTGYVYWVDETSFKPKLKRAKFDGTADGADLDSCFSVGSGVNQLGDPFSGSITAFVTLGLYSITDDTIKIRTATDSVTSIYSASDRIKAYKYDGAIAAIDTANFTAANILCETNDGTKAVVVIDTLNSQLRIAFGLKEITNLTFLNFGGKTLLYRCIGRLAGSEQDSIFSVGKEIKAGADLSSYWPSLSAYYYAADTTFKAYFETNMHRFLFYSHDYCDSAQIKYYLADTSMSSFFDWNTFDLFVKSYFDASIDSLDQHSIDETIPILYTWNNYDLSLISAYSGGTINYEKIKGSHTILSASGLSAGDNFDTYSNTSFPRSALSADLYGNSSDDADWQPLVDISWTGRLPSAGYGLNVSITNFWFVLGLSPSYTNYYLFSDDFRNIIENGIIWLVEKSSLFPPSGVTATALNDSSFIISWTDNSDDELGFKVYLKSGGQYTGPDILLSTLAADVTADTISGFWPPNSQWYFDVGCWKSGTDTIQSSTPGSGYLHAKVPQKPIVYALSDTSINIIINGYNHYDLFTDTTLSTNPAWVRTGGGWNVERSYNRLRTTSTSNIISTKYDGSSRDIEIRTMFHFNDSLRLNSQSVEFHFVSSNNTGTGDGYYIYADSVKLQVRKQTGGSDVDTLYDGTYTGNYKWRTLRLTNDWTKYPGYKSIHWGFFLDGTLQGVFNDTAYQKINYIVLKGSHRRQWWDSFWIKHYPYPAGNDSTTTYAVYDSVTNKYLTSTGSWRTSAVWQTYSAWDSTVGTMGIVSPYTAKRIRVKARSN